MPRRMLVPRSAGPGLALLLTACSSSTPRPEAPAEIVSGDTVEVVRVAKGDELGVRKEGKSARVRLFGIYAFDVTDSEGEGEDPSVTFLDEHVINQKVKITLDEPRQDIHGRYLAYVEHAGKDLGLELIENGAAIVYTEYVVPRQEAYLAAEERARSMRAGLWQNESTVRLARGLRKQWAEFRSQRSGAKLEDPLLAPVSGASAVPPSP